jgi:TRAP-type C4-dicarboxylate transport system permease small subunit
MSLMMPPCRLRNALQTAIELIITIIIFDILIVLSSKLYLRNLSLSLSLSLSLPFNFFFFLVHIGMVLTLRATLHGHYWTTLNGI